MTLLRLALAAIVVLLPSPLFGQATGTGTVTGRVVDVSGGVLPGVTVTLKSTEALGQYSGVTGPDGTYRVANLPPAAYEVRAELSGFQTAINKVVYGSAVPSRSISRCRWER